MLNTIHIPSVFNSSIRSNVKPKMFVQFNRKWFITNVFVFSTFIVVITRPFIATNNLDLFLTIYNNRYVNNYLYYFVNN
jgi:hypothetical protein